MQHHRLELRPICTKSELDGTKLLTKLFCSGKHDRNNDFQNVYAAKGTKDKYCKHNIEKQYSSLRAYWEILSDYTLSMAFLKRLLFFRFNFPFFLPFRELFCIQNCETGWRITDMQPLLASVLKRQDQRKLSDQGT